MGDYSDTCCECKAPSVDVEKCNDKVPYVCSHCMKNFLCFDCVTVKCKNTEIPGWILCDDCQEITCWHCKYYNKLVSGRYFYKSCPQCELLICSTCLPNHTHKGSLSQLCK